MRFVHAFMYITQREWPLNMDNKLTGSFYTPQELIEYMAKYISGRITPRSILEPSAGDGRFIPAISIFDCPITAVELYKEKVDTLHMHCGKQCEIICADFLSYALETEKKYDFIIGNPPYISKKSLPECQRNLSLKLVKHFKLDEALFQNIWVSFILASLKVLSPNGSIFFVLPFEFLQVQYAEHMLDDDGLTNQEELKSIEHILDRFEKILDAYQEERIKKANLYEQAKDEFAKKQQANEERLSKLYEKLNRYLEEMKND